MATDGSDSNERSHVVFIIVADCPNTRKILKVAACADGDAFVVHNQGVPDNLVHPGRTLVIPDYQAPRPSGGPGSKGWIRLPDRIQEAQLTPSATYVSGDLVLTPGAVHTSPGVDFLPLGVVFTDPQVPEAAEDLRNALDPFLGDELLLSAINTPLMNNEGQMFLDLRKGLMVGSLFTLLVAGVSLLVVALEQMRERRRAIAALSATGVPIRILVRSLMWQNAIPMLLALVLAVVSGVGLAILVFRLMSLRAVVDWANISVMSLTAGVLILLITTLTLPTLKSATRLTALRTE
jgi:predicted lysophospholipase L1 biosynthesis ABC-type transport system permease subunit